MTRKITISILLLTLALSACGQGTAATPYPDSVDWETAVEILNTGEVEAIYQLHNLSVTLEMKDGSMIETVEPVIDAIFHEIEKCGDPCSEIIMATE